MTSCYCSCNKQYLQSVYSFFFAIFQSHVYNAKNLADPAIFYSCIRGFIEEMGAILFSFPFFQSYTTLMLLLEFSTNMCGISSALRGEMSQQSLRRNRFDSPSKLPAPSIIITVGSRPTPDNPHSATTPYQGLLPDRHQRDSNAAY